MGKVSGGVCVHVLGRRRERSVPGRAARMQTRPSGMHPCLQRGSPESGGLQTTWQPLEARGLWLPKTWFAAPSRGSRPQA